jgi:hypothetical protein
MLGRPDVVRLLLEHFGATFTFKYGASLSAAALVAAADERDKNGSAALHYAALGGHDHVCKVLLDRSASVNVSDSTGVRPLHLAAESGHACTVALLLARGSDVNASDEEGNTPILLAAEGGHDFTCTMLAASGADPFTTNLCGRSAMSIARKGGSRELVRCMMHPPLAEKVFADVQWMAPAHDLDHEAMNVSLDDTSFGTLGVEDHRQTEAFELASSLTGHLGVPSSQPAWLAVH